MIRVPVIAVAMVILAWSSQPSSSQWLPQSGRSYAWLMWGSADVVENMAAHPELDVWHPSGWRIVGHYCPDGLHPTGPLRCASGLMNSSPEFVDWWLNEPSRFVEVRFFLIDERARVRSAVSVPVFPWNAKRGQLRDVLRRMDWSAAEAMFARAPYNPALQLTVAPVTPPATASGAPGPSGRARS